MEEVDEGTIRHLNIIERGDDDRTPDLFIIHNKFGKTSAACR